MPPTPASPPHSSIARWITVAVAAVAAIAATRLVDSAAVRLGLAVLAAALLVAGWLPTLRRRWPPPRWDTLLLALAVAALCHTAALDLFHFATTPWVRVWNVYHYYLGAQYFAEIGYDDLYSATLAADREGRNYWRKIDRVRNLRTYEVEPRERAEATYDPAAHFSPDRWHAFQQDVAALQTQMPAKDWRGVFRDRGYNPSVFWTAAAAPLTRLLPATRPVALKVLASLDLVLLALTFGLLYRTFGLRTASWILLLFCLSPVNTRRLVGGFLQYDWFCAIAVGLAWVKRRRALPAAAALAYATLARVFPLVLVGSLLLPALASWIRRGRLSRFALRFGAAFALFCGLGLGVGLLAGHGVSGWTEFVARIRHHSDEHTYGEQRVGLKHLFTHEIGHEIGQEMGDGEVDRSIGERRETFARQENLYRGAAAVFLVLFLAAVARRNGRDALLLGLIPVFAVAVASRYYWACLALLPALSAATARRRRRVEALILGQLVVYGGYALFDLFDPSAYALYSLFNLLLAPLLLGLALSYAAGDLRALRRLRRQRHPLGAAA